MDLVKLYGVTGENKNLELAQYILDIRQGGDEYNQAHKPVAEQDKIIGHAVRATYIYSGMANRKVIYLRANLIYHDQNSKLVEGFPDR